MLMNSFTQECSYILISVYFSVQTYFWVKSTVVFGQTTTKHAYVYTKSYLVGTPVPSGQYGEPQCHARPGQVSGDRVSEQVHGVLTWEVTRTVGNDLTGHCHAVHLLQITIASDLVEGCGPGS